MLVNKCKDKVSKVGDLSRGSPKAPFSIATIGGARGVMGIVVGNGHGDTSSNPGRDWLHFT